MARNGRSDSATTSTALRNGAWSAEEDQKLLAYINRYGIWNWCQMPRAAGLCRSGKSCRLRWINYLKPGVKRGGFSKEENDTIIMLHRMVGNRWSKIATSLPGRTDNDIKNHWHTHLKKQSKMETQMVAATASQANVVTSQDSSSTDGSSTSSTHDLIMSDSPLSVDDYDVGSSTNFGWPAEASHDESLIEEHLHYYETTFLHDEEFQEHLQKMMSFG